MAPKIEPTTPEELTGVRARPSGCAAVIYYAVNDAYLEVDADLAD